MCMSVCIYTCGYIYVSVYICVYAYVHVLHSISFQTFFVQAFRIVEDS